MAMNPLPWSLTRGNFSGPTYTRPRVPPARIMHWSVQMLVIQATIGLVTDSGGSNDYPDLAAWTCYARLRRRIRSPGHLY